DRQGRARRAGGRRGAPAHELPVRPARGARRVGRPRAGARDAHGPRRPLRERGLRPLDRRARLAHPRRDRGRPAASPPAAHGARRRLRARAPPGRGVMRRLATQIHLTIVAVLVLFAALSGATWWHAAGVREQARFADAVSETASEVLPGPERPVAELQATLDRFGPRFDVEAAIYSPDRTLRAWVGSPLPVPEGSGFRGHWTRLRGHVLFAVQLPDGRHLVAARHPELRHGVGLVATLALLALAVGLGAWPLVGRLTRRLERLRARVED